jgi:putative Mg2+ transporter-C (MgtC) family protein
LAATVHPTLDPLSIDNSAFWLRLLTAILCGGAIGLERQLRGKAAGIRTSILVCMGTMLFIAMGDAFPTARTDPSRVLGQVITGIGFLGAGVILVSDGRLLGVTSAAVIWVLAGLGAMIGLGRLATAMIVTLATLAILIGVEAIESVWKRLRTGSVDKELDNLHIDM